MRLRRATRVQKIMIAFMALAIFALLGFSVYEIAGVVDTASSEDTFSEWVWDLPLWARMFWSGLFLVVSAIGSWAAVHFFVDGRHRRDKPFKDDEYFRDSA